MANTAFDHNPTITIPGSGNTTDNAVVLWNGTTGNNFSNSVVIINAGAITGVTALTVDNININGNTIISTDSNGSITLTPNGTGSVVISKVDINAGTIDGATIGATSASTVVATQVDITGQGDLRLQDTTGGQHVAIQAAGTTTTHTLTLPATQGGASTVLTNDGSGGLTWAAVSGGAAISGTPANNQVAVWTNATTIEGDSEFTWTESVLTVKQGASGGASGYNAKLIVESNTHAGISILAPDNSEMNLTFASPSQSQLAGIVANYNSNSEYMSLVVAGVEVLKINDGYVDCLTQDKGLRVRQVLNLYTPSNGGAPEIFWTEGDGTGSANNMKYRMAYNGTSNNYFSFRSYDTNGSSADDDIWRVYDGTAELRLNNNLGSNFDKYDDALVLERHFSDPYRAGQDLIQESQDELIEMGILVKDSDGWIGQSLNRWVPLLAGGVYQTRQRVDNLYEELKAEIKELKAEIDELKG